MTKHIIAVIALLASFGANATICNPTCEQPAPKKELGEKVVDLRLSDETSDTVMTKLRIQGSPYSNTDVRIGLYEVAINDKLVDAFCVDPFQPASKMNSKYIESKLDATDFISNGTVKFELAQRLYDNAYGSLATATNAVKAGFHVALWEIFYDEEQNTSSGNIQSIADVTTKPTKTCAFLWFGCKTTPGKIIKGTDAEVLKEANWFLTALTKPEWKITNKYDLTFYKSVCNQDFIVAKLNPPGQIPLPAALPLFISGLVGFGLMRRRKSA